VRAALAFAFLITVSTAAAADDHGPVVHVESPVAMKVSVEPAAGGAPVCEAPCDKALDAGVPYRLTASGIRPTNAFHLVAGEGEARLRVRLEPHGQGWLWSGVVLLSLGVALAGAGAIVTAWGFGDLGPRATPAAAIATPLFTSALAMGIPGAVMIANNLASRATVMGEDAAVSNARPAVSRPAAFIIPLVHRSF